MGDLTNERPNLSGSFAVGRHWSSRHPLQGGSCHDCNEQLSIRIIFLYFYKYYNIYSGGFFLDLSCSFTNAAIAAIMLNDYRSRKEVLNQIDELMSTKGNLIFNQFSGNPSHLITL